MGKDNYFKKVYYVTCQIPPGRVSTYGAIADYLALGSARMVGWALNKSLKEQEPVPAHRVVNREGALSGRNNFSYPGLMEELLMAEGIEVENDRIVNFEKYFWHPQEGI